jgi:hypothetical protein
MKVFESFESNDTAHATVQLKAHEFAALRNYMHTPAEFSSIKFVHGVYLDYRACGWYRLKATNEFRAIEKIQLALRVIKKFHAQLESGEFVPTVQIKVRTRVQKFRPTVAQRAAGIASAEQLTHAHIPVQPTLPSKPVIPPTGDPIPSDGTHLPPSAPPVPTKHNQKRIPGLTLSLLQRHFGQHA